MYTLINAKSDENFWQVGKTEECRFRFTLDLSQNVKKTLTK